eukprot:jgi/Botrbrau1/8312/Bobra.0081s0001.1
MTCKQPKRTGVNHLEVWYLWLCQLQQAVILNHVAPRTNADKQYVLFKRLFFDARAIAAVVVSLLPSHCQKCRRNCRSFEWSAGLGIRLTSTPVQIAELEVTVDP